MLRYSVALAMMQHTPRFWMGLLRAFGGALIFALPLLMTTEMWWLGFYINPTRLALFLVLNIPLLTGISYFAGFEETFNWLDDAVDAFVACAVGFATAAIMLLLFGLLRPGMSANEIAGKIAIQAIGGSIGAVLARSQFGNQQERAEEDQKKRRARYAGKLFFMAIGILVLTYALAPTAEMILIAYSMTAWHTVALALISLGVMHAFTQIVELPGEQINPSKALFWRIGLRYTAVGYALALLISVYMLWTFGRIDGMAVPQVVFAAVVLGFPAAVGAGAARLIL